MPRTKALGVSKLFGFERLAAVAEDLTSTVTLIPIESVLSDPNQPRRTHDQEKDRELRDSIEREGLLHPILVRPVGEDQYMVVAGHRRLEAFRALGRDRIPAIVREMDDEEARIIALIENLQREDLSDIDRALALKEIKELRKLTWEQVGQLLGLTKRSVLRLVGLTELPDGVIEAIESGALTARHGMVIGQLSDEEDQTEIARLAQRQGWTSDETAKVVREVQRGNSPQKAVKVLKMGRGDTRVTFDTVAQSLGRLTRRFEQIAANLAEKPPSGDASGIVTLLKELRRKVDALVRHLEKGAKAKNDPQDDKNG